MKQSEQISAILGTGTVVLTECSNDLNHLRPKITIMLPAWVEYGAYENAAVHHPATSLELNSNQVEQLYTFLKGYYTS